jgi:ubiquinone/menaquinone biosynthesis C-methylase UbiE
MEKMNHRISRGHCPSDLYTSKIAFWMITFMHDNPLLPIFRDPFKLLETAGLKSGQIVLEVGCGPGFFTIPAAKIVGDKGFVYAVDVHPLAIERVKRKIETGGIKNIKPFHANASMTGLGDESIDLAFIFGLPYVAGGLEKVIAELHRILRTGGMLSYEKTRGSERKLIEAVERGGFMYLERRKRVFLFRRMNKNGGQSHEKDYEKGFS